MPRPHLPLAIVLLLPPATAARAEAPPAGSEFERLNASSGNLITVAGTGTVDDTNAWIPAFEGADPTAVELSNPHMTMADALGRIYIADKESHSVLRLSADRSILTTVAGTHSPGNGGDAEAYATSVALSNPNGLYTLPDGTTYILDLDNRKIRRLDPSSGTLRTVLTDPGGFGAGRGLWVSQDESRIYYNGALGAGSSQSVQTWTPEAGIQTFTSLPGDLGNLTVDPGGHLVVTSRAQHRVYRVSLDGTTFTTIAGNGTTARAVSGQPALATGMERVRGIAFRPDGSYFLCSQKGGDVLFVDTAGIAHVYLTGAANGNNRNGDGSPPDAPGGPKISEPRAVSLAPDGTLLITTNDNGFVRAVPSLCPPAPPTSLTLTRSQDTLTLSFPPAGDTPYILETSPDLNGDWSPLGFTVDGTADLPADGRGGYFRVRAPRWQP